MWKITKAIDFCYGHRVWSQELNKEFSLDSKLVCRHLHGHQGQVIVELKGKSVKHGMVTDFKHLNWFKKFVDDYLDHKFIIDHNDPMLPGLMSMSLRLSDYSATLRTLKPHYYQKHNLYGEVFYTPKLPETGFLSHDREFLEGLVIVQFVPTSENIAQWLFKMVQNKMKEIDITVSSLTFKETPKTSAEYCLTND